ncbi:hypothetical protein quinque_004607 [Culex quinquefasciatus]
MEKMIREIYGWQNGGAYEHPSPLAALCRVLIILIILSKGLNQALNRNQNTDVCPFEEDYLVGRLIRGDHRCDDDSDGTNSDDCVDIEPYNIEAKPRQEADGYDGKIITIRIKAMKKQILEQKLAKQKRIDEMREKCAALNKNKKKIKHFTS